MDGSNLTRLIYSHIKEGEYKNAIHLLEAQLEKFSTSTAALSLLAYSYYQLEEYDKASTYYEQLVEICPEKSSDSERYRFYFANSLLKAGAIDDSTRIIAALPPSEDACTLLMAARVESNDLAGARAVLVESSRDDPTTLLTSATIAFKEGDFDEALAGYGVVLEKIGFRPDVAYNEALCLYRLKKDSGRALEKTIDIISRGLEKYPGLAELSLDVNDTALKATYLIEAYNLKAALEFDAGDVAAAAATLAQMPYRPEEDLDAVTLQNLAIMRDIGTDISSTFRKLQFLLSNPPFPPETFANILLLYINHGYEDLAADLLADNSRLTEELLSQELYHFLDSSLLAATSPDDALDAFDTLSRQILQRIRKRVKVVSEAEASGDDEIITAAHAGLRHAMKELVPVMMSMCKIHWDTGDFQAVERILRQSGEFCGDTNACAINLGHAYFVQNKYREAAVCYEPLVNDETSILNIPPIVLANLCVSYVLTERNETAEEIIALVEHAEEAAASARSDDEANNEQLFHGSIINLVIGTLYCSKKNYDFGMSMICKSLEPYDQRLGPDTWLHAKRCLLALLKELSKHMITIADETVSGILAFLDNVDRHGQKISPTATDDDYFYMPSESEGSIATEARKLKLAFMRLV